MKRLLTDGWFQMFAAIAGLSVLIMALDRLAPKPLLPEPPVAADPAPPAPAPVSAPAPAAVPAPVRSAASSTGLTAPPSNSRAESSRAEAASRLSPEALVRATPEDRSRGASASAPWFRPAAANGAAVSAPAANYPIFKIAPKTPGRWIVSNQDGADVDSPSIARVIFSASDGDVVLIRPGMYLEPLLVLHKTLTFRGLGSRPEEVLITSPDPSAVLNVSHATVNLENVRIEPEKGFSATAAAVHVVSGRLSLRNVLARSQGAAIQAAQGPDLDTVVNAVSSRLDGAYADVLVRGKARVALKNVDFTNARQPIVVWRDTDLEIDSCRFPKDPKARIYAYEESPVSVDESPTAPLVASTRGDADANADKSKFSSNQAFPRPGRNANGRSGFVRDIFRQGRRPGDLN